jgi:chromosomal replication initiator protein
MDTTIDNIVDELDVKQLWENVLVEIELDISNANFNTWFKDTYIIKIDNGVVYLGVKNEFARDWLLKKFHKLILRALRGFLGGARGLEYVIIKDEKKKNEAKYQVQVVGAGDELPLQNYYINKDDNLNPRYVFETFVVGPFNELAYAASRAIIDKPGIVYNPFFVYGGTGHGKTHLIQAIGNYLKKTGVSKKVYYVTSEKFTIDYINAVQNNKVNTVFKEKYRQYDALIMDDIQFLSGKEKTQEELFHLFNALYDNNKQIIFSSDKHPNYIQNLEDRLKSRFSAGMIVDIPQPDHESRVAILKAKSSQNRFILQDDVIDYLADSVQGNIRDLEGILNSIICQSQLKGRELNLAEIKNLIKNNARPKKSVSVKDVIKHVTGFYNIDENDIFKKTRIKEIVKPRQLIMFILREDFNVSYPTIGQKLGGRDHTTVIHSCEKIKNDLKTDELLSQELN